MYTSLFVLTMVGALAENQAPAWQTYEQASQTVGQVKKPMAVFLGSGDRGWENVAGSLGQEAEKTLNDDYVRVYIDTDTAAGKKLAQAFEMKSGRGIVISDRRGENQAYWHEGNLSQSELVRQLQRHGTESQTRNSFYPSLESGSSPTIMQGGSYCPSCNARRR